MLIYMLVIPAGVGCMYCTDRAKGAMQNSIEGMRMFRNKNLLLTGKKMTSTKAGTI